MLQWKYQGQISSKLQGFENPGPPKISLHSIAIPITYILLFPSVVPNYVWAPTTNQFSKQLQLTKC